MAYTNFTNCTEQEYLDVIYSQEDRNRIRIWFNNIELVDADLYCEKFSGKNRILPEDGNKRFALSNFVAKEYDLILRDIPSSTVIQDQVKISIGTLVGENTYEDVPIGIFNIQNEPVNDKGRITIKLRDNRVKFDFGYNAQPLIESLGGTATYKQILNDICTQAGVTNTVTTFNGENIAVSIYDNTVTGTSYVSYIAEQAGAIPSINRNGELIFVYINNLKTWRIPLSIVEKYELGTPYQIQRVVYETGVVKYETSPDETLDTLYLDSANPYITSQTQVDSINLIVNNFRIDSATTGRILGNPAMDAYDLIQIYDDYEENEPTILTTFANNSYVYNGVNRNEFTTQIGKEERKENVTLNSQKTFKRWAKTQIDNVEAIVEISAGEVETLNAQINGQYVLTSDTTFQDNKQYYIRTDLGYQEYNNYNVGDPIPANTIYEFISSNSLEERVRKAELELNSQGLKLDVVSTNIDPISGDVLAVKTEKFEFNENGFTTTGDDGYSAISNQTGTYYYDNKNMVGKYTKDGSVQKDLALSGKYYYGIDEDVNVENFTKNDAMMVTQLFINNNNEEVIGHFTNQI